MISIDDVRAAAASIAGHAIRTPLLPMPGGSLWLKPENLQPVGAFKVRGATHALAAFDLRTGVILWQLWLESDVMSAPVAAGEFVYVTTFTGTVSVRRASMRSLGRST